ncbi:MAG: hypothetical protein KF866_00960 [Phycisphaeraceae bacterium]|nr:hypothetical protein [Phycisphaeraceae bacterium]MCW5755087.1 hypothetical protein [Phycisphaeraceae bacterium]
MHKACDSACVSDRIAPGTWLPRVAAMVAIVAGTTVSFAQTAPGEPVGGNPFGMQHIDPPSQDDLARLSDDVKVSEYDLVELHVTDEDLQTILQMLSIQGQRSIVATQNVSGTVTANLYGVTFEQALESILVYNGFGYIESNGVIYVMPQEQIQQELQRQRQREYIVIRMNYLNAVDAAQFAQPLLSQGGTIVTNGATQDFSIPSDRPTGKDDYALEAILVVHDFTENIDAIRKLLIELDTRPISMLIEATILQSALNEANAFGIDFAIIGDMNFSDFTPVGGPLRIIDNILQTTGTAGSDDDDSSSGGVFPGDNKGRGLVSNVGQVSEPGGLKAGIVTNNVAAFIRLLDQVGDTTILSNPKILTLNRQPARVQVGRRVGYLSTTTTDTSTSQTVQFLDTGTQLYVRPFASNDGFIRMELRPEVSQPIIRNVTDATGAAVTVPDEDTSHIVTNVMVRDGQTVVLGGLFTERTTANRRQVPVIGDIPILGIPFRGHDDSIDRSEIIFVITPSRVNDQILTQQGAEAMNYVSHIRAGAREGLLPWSRERMSSQLLVDAERSANKGDSVRALHKVQRALALKPMQPDAIKLREKLLTTPTVWPSHSVLEDLINDEVSRRAELLGRSVPTFRTVEPTGTPTTNTTTVTVAQPTFNPDSDAPHACDAYEMVSIDDSADDLSYTDTPEDFDLFSADFPVFEGRPEYTGHRQSPQWSLTSTFEDMFSALWATVDAMGFTSVNDPQD